MKKMIGFFLIILLLFVASYFEDNKNVFQDYNKIAIVSSIYYEKYQNNLVESGNNFYYFFNADQEYDLNDFEKIKGINYYFDKNIPFSYFEKKVDFIYKGEGKVDNYQIYYGYYGKYDDYRYVFNKKVNFELVKTDNEWIMGFPLILTGY